MDLSKKYFFTIITLFILTSILFIFFVVHAQSAEMRSTLWQFQAVDTMKYSRDPARDPGVVRKIPKLVKQVADLKATHISIATPYNEEFYPFLKTWVKEARRYNLKIWFRGNISEWEGWFGYQKTEDPQEHHLLVSNFIQKYPDLFEEGDIFTPAPEAENGGFGDPRGSSEKSRKFNQFLVDSYINCVQSFEIIRKNVRCGYFSMNGDVAREVLTKDTVQKTGNVVVIDHYVNSPEKMAEDIEHLYKKFDAKIVLGEFGAPIPDINGDMTDQEQALFIDELMLKLYEKRNIIEGLNYWVIAGGSTSLLHDNLSPRLATNVIRKYFEPNVWKGKIADQHGTAIFNARINVDDKPDALTATQDGTYYVTTPVQSVKITISHDDYLPETKTITFGNEKEITQTITLKPRNENWWDKIRMFFKGLFAFLPNR